MAMPPTLTVSSVPSHKVLYGGVDDTLFLGAPTSGDVQGDTPRPYDVVPPAGHTLTWHLRGSTSLTSPRMTAPGILSIVSTNVHSSSAASAPWPRTARGWPPTTSPEPRRRGTMPSSRTRACPRESASASCVPSASAQQFMAPAYSSSHVYHSHLLCRSMLIASMPCCAMPVVSQAPRRPSCSWAGSRTTFTSTSSFSSRGISSRPCTWPGPSRPAQLRRHRPRRRGAPIPRRAGQPAPTRAPLCAPLQQQPPTPRGHANPSRKRQPFSPVSSSLPYRTTTRGHVCKRLFYLELADFIDDDIPANISATTGPHDHDVVAGTAPGG
jgi:hypothetical protein